MKKWLILPLMSCLFLQGCAPLIIGYAYVQHDKKKASQREAQAMACGGRVVGSQVMCPGGAVNASTPLSNTSGAKKMYPSAPKKK